MIETEARVVETQEGCAWVETRPHSSCGHCDPETGCRSLSISRLFCVKPQRYQVSDPLGCRRGESVVVAIHERGLLKSALLMYLLPIVALFIGAVLGGHWSETASALAGLLSFFVAILMIRRYSTKYRHDADFQPHIIRRLGVTTLTVEKPRS